MTRFSIVAVMQWCISTCVLLSQLGIIQGKIKNALSGEAISNANTLTVDIVANKGFVFSHNNRVLVHYTYSFDISSLIQIIKNEIF